MADWLTGGVAAITGAGSGIGAALAQDLARRGMHLALADRNAQGLEATAASARSAGVMVTTHAFDVTDRAACGAWPQQVLDAHGKVTVLANNAGVAVGGTFQQVAADDFEWLLDINFHAPVRLTRAFLPLLARERAAQVVNVSSIFGIIAPPGQTAYSSAKFALRGFSESLRHELERDGSPVRVTVVHPGGVRTAIASSAKVPAGATQEELAQHQKAWKAVLKMAPEDAARTIGDAIARRAPRVLVGKDAKQAAFLQRLAPVTYWKYIGAKLAREIERS
ncbi:SDR family NAD(P)-dependent oxidoreductase [Ramlibacter algicola]|uniref:SDR family NAD(P)-dependent oxidoreductase n=1 Tax=Ramlibacter algicola TaxID=2795217 RepID=A0A934Q0G7_9BURK|nr:SDR family NAD(P)-dependent oxidoreductase [Ramlibacter algicola]MBK0392372.1 SDR family NAD(P)-dependent oxidoreductase [Ramlibacter algicola]